jgi:hypothetical protein
MRATVSSGVRDIELRDVADPEIRQSTDVVVPWLRNTSLSNRIII